MTSEELKQRETILLFAGTGVYEISELAFMSAAKLSTMSDLEAQGLVESSTLAPYIVEGEQKQNYRFTLTQSGESLLASYL